MTLSPHDHDRQLTSAARDFSYAGQRLGKTVAAASAAGITRQAAHERRGRQETASRLGSYGEWGSGFDPTRLMSSTTLSPDRGKHGADVGSAASFRVMPLGVAVDHPPVRAAETEAGIFRRPAGPPAQVPAGYDIPRWSSPRRVCLGPPSEFPGSCPRNRALLPVDQNLGVLVALDRGQVD